MKALPDKKPEDLIAKWDIFQLGEHYLMCGDSRELDWVQMFVGDRKISVVLTDPPYGVEYVESKAGFSNSKHIHKPIENDYFATDGGYYRFSDDWLRAIVDYMTPENAFYIFNSDRRFCQLRDAMLYAGIHFGQTLIWEKNNIVMGRMDYLPKHELIVYGWYRKRKFVKAKDKSILYYPKPARSILHPTMKPIPLLRRLILNSSYVGDWVYDPFGGSGSTLIACEQTRRRCLMVEIDPEYCQIIINRFKKMSKLPVTKIYSWEIRSERDKRGKSNSLSIN